MNIKIIGRTIGQVLLIESIFMAPSLIWCGIDQDGRAAVALLISHGAGRRCRRSPSVPLPPLPQSFLGAGRLYIGGSMLDNPLCVWGTPLFSQR